MISLSVKCLRIALSRWLYVARAVAVAPEAGIRMGMFIVENLSCGLFAFQVCSFFGQSVPMCLPINVRDRQTIAVLIRFAKENLNREAKQLEGLKHGDRLGVDIPFRQGKPYSCWEALSFLLLPDWYCFTLHLISM